LVVAQEAFAAFGDVEQLLDKLKEMRRRVHRALAPRSYIRDRGSHPTISSVALRKGFFDG
jgi:hypothetical protein